MYVNPVIYIHMKNLMKVFLIFTMSFLLTMCANAKNYYFSSSTGNDNYTAAQAQNKATPWASLLKLTRMTTNGTVCFLPGDSVLFKRGDVFANGMANGYCSAYWWNVNDPTSPNAGYFTGPSGTPGHPIVISNYGDPSLPLPNWLYPTASSPHSNWNGREGRAIIEFAGVHDIIIDGIQSNDYRLAESDKVTPGFSGGWILGEWTRGNSAGARNSYNDTSRRKLLVTNLIVRNCVFNNCIYGINGLAGVDCKITNNIFTNFKSSADTAGTNDVLGAALEGINGIRCEISHNYIKGGWSKSGRISSTLGMGGVGMDIFNIYNSKICYNTIIDCSGAFECGNLDQYDTTAGSQYDTFAFNKVINTGQLSYFHGTGFFAGTNHHIAFWNNTIVSNNKDRFNGAGFGKDVYGDGQGWAPGTPNPFWFCRDPFNTLNVNPMKPTVSTTQGSNIITVSSAAGISIGSVWFTDNDNLASIEYKTVTVTNINGTTLTLSDTSTRTVNGYVCSNESGFYLPVSNQTWSNPFNPAYANYSGHRMTIQYGTDATDHGSYIDTMFDFRNNITYWTTGVQGIYDRTRFKRSGNIYYYRGGARYATSLGGTINNAGSKERAMTTGMLFKDTTAALPDNWDLHLNDTSYARTNGVSIGSAFTTDFDGNSIVGVTPFIGMYQPSSAPVSCTSYTYGTWTTCLGGTQTRAYIANPLGCSIGTPPTDSISRTCVVTCSFIYSAWTTCLNGTQSRTYSRNPAGCTGTPPADSLLRTCTETCVITYSAWSGCVNGVQTRTYTKNPGTCSIIPPTDSLQRACFVPCTSFAYGTWSACVNSIQTRSYTAIPLGCNSGTPDPDSISRVCSTVLPLKLAVSTIRSATCLNRTDGYIVVKASGGTSPYSYSINSTLVYVANKTSFSGLLPGTYIIRVKDLAGQVTPLTVVVPSRRNRKC